MSWGYVWEYTQGYLRYTKAQMAYQQSSPVINLLHIVKAIINL